MGIDYQKILVYNVDDDKYRKINSGFEHVEKLVKEYCGDKYVFVNTGHGTFYGPNSFLKDSKEYNGQHLVETANEKGVIFYMWEPICCYSKSNNHLRLSFYNEFSNGVRDIYSREIDHVIDYCEQAGITNYEIKICDFDYNSLFLDSYPDVDIQYTDIYLKSMDFAKPKQVENTLEKRFICANSRYTPHRHLIMCNLADKDGIYSWNFICEEFLFDGITWLDKTNRYFNDILNGNRILNSNVFNIDHNLPKTWVDKLTDFESVSQYMDHANKKDFYRNVFCAVVNETRFAQPFANFSEKVLRPINFNLPFILVAPPFTLKLLKSYGFKTFDQWWPEDYDLEEDHSKRLYRIFEIIDYINNLSQTQIENIYNDMMPTLLFNSDMLQNIDRSI